MTSHPPRNQSNARLRQRRVPGPLVPVDGEFSSTVGLLAEEVREPHPRLAASLVPDRLYGISAVFLLRDAACGVEVQWSEVGRETKMKSMETCILQIVARLTAFAPHLGPHVVFAGVAASCITACQPVWTLPFEPIFSHTSSHTGVLNGG